MKEKSSKVSLNGADLKWIATVSMLLDHIGYALIYKGGYINKMLTCYIICWLIGRIAFPIYLFLLVEGYKHTKNIKSYLLRLVVFAFVSEIPADLAFFGKIYTLEYQNIYFTLSIILIMFVGIDKIRELFKNKIISMILSGCIIIAACIISEILNFDYGYVGPLLGMIMFLCHDKIKFYNGKRGKQNKYFFYLFYPVHLFILYLIRTYLL